MLASTLYLLAAGVDYGTVDKIGGYFGLVTAAIAYWLAAAELVNDILGEGEELIPLGHFDFVCLRKRKSRVACNPSAKTGEEV